ncbi:replication-relaxation family protein [Paenibacillus cellulositrophicus]|uniref:replication-relaxation family protein n=1 Tax=Paenibacillus cellulositrophicus TaxID=562959 RepID=UPI003F8006C2
MNDTGKNDNKSSGIKIQESEESLFIDLYDMIFLDLDYIHKVNYPDIKKTTMLIRIRKLEDLGYIQAHRALAGTTKKVLSLAEVGVQEVRDLLGEAKWDSRWVKRSSSFIYHSLHVASVRAAFQMTETGHAAISYKEWVSERRSYYQYGSSPNEIIVPDGTLVLERELEDRPPAYFGYFIEMERSRQRAQVSQNKLRRYAEYCARDGFKKQSFDHPLSLVRVLWVSATENEVLRLMEHTKKIDTKAIQAVLYTTLDEVNENPYGEIWRAKGSSDPQKKYKLFSNIEN